MYANPTDGADWEDINADRYQLLKDQLNLYKADKISWSIWLYKDIGFQGMVYVIIFLRPRLSGVSWLNQGLLAHPFRHAGRDTPYICHFRDFLTKKKKLAADKWGADVRAVANIFDPLVEWLRSEVRNSSTRWVICRHQYLLLLVDIHPSKPLPSPLESPTARGARSTLFALLNVLRAFCIPGSRVG